MRRKNILPWNPRVLESFIAERHPWNGLQKQMRPYPKFLSSSVNGWEKGSKKKQSAAGPAEVRLEHVKTCQQRFLNQMEDEVKGYQVETCFGPSGCPNRAVICDEFPRKIEDRFRPEEPEIFLKEKVKGPLKMHHEFRVSISDCPNACSRPQIADLGLIGARSPMVADEPCSECGACVEACREESDYHRQGGEPSGSRQVPLLRPVYHGLPHGHPPGKGKRVPHSGRRKTGPASPPGRGNSGDLWVGRNLTNDRPVPGSLSKHCQRRGTLRRNFGANGPLFLSPSSLNEEGVG